MPIYEYICQSCQHRFEVKQSMTEPPLSSCVRCGQAVTKVISAPAIMFKGTGWYVTDYSDKLKPSAESKQDDASASDKKKEDKTSSESTAATGAATPATSGSSGGSSNSPSTAGSSVPPAAQAAPSSTPSE